jgi:four helix bundle protein
MSDAPRQDLKERAFRFTSRILGTYRRLAAISPAHADMARQLLKSATAIGALLQEAEVANSRRDLASKLAIALRESRETNYWLRLFSLDPDWIEELAPLVQESREFVAMLTVSVRKLRAAPAEGSNSRSVRVAPRSIAT